MWYHLASALTTCTPIDFLFKATSAKKKKTSISPEKYWLEIICLFKMVPFSGQMESYFTNPDFSKMFRDFSSNLSSFLRIFACKSQANKKSELMVKIVGLGPGGVGILRVTLQGINISHLGKRKIIFKMPFLGDMLVPWRVSNTPFQFDQRFRAQGTSQARSLSIGHHVPTPWFHHLRPPKKKRDLSCSCLFRGFVGDEIRAPVKYSR